MLWVQGIEPRSPGRSTGAFNCHLFRSSLFFQHAFELSLLSLHGPVTSPGTWLWPAWDKYADNNWHSAVGIRTWALSGSVVQALCTWPCRSYFLIYFPLAPSLTILTLSPRSPGCWTWGLANARQVLCTRAPSPAQAWHSLLSRLSAVVLIISVVSSHLHKQVRESQLLPRLCCVVDIASSHSHHVCSRALHIGHFSFRPWISCVCFLLGYRLSKL